MKTPRQRSLFHTDSPQGQVCEEKERRTWEEGPDPAVLMPILNLVSGTPPRHVALGGQGVGGRRGEVTPTQLGRSGHCSLDLLSIFFPSKSVGLV